MSTTYYYYTGPLVDIVTRVSNLNDKYSIDLELSSTYISTTYNISTGNVEIVFSTSLIKSLANIMDRLAKISLFDAQVQDTVYVVDTNSFNRRSFETGTGPTNLLDEKSGYSPGSMVTTNDNNIYICTNNNDDNAVWCKMFSDENPDNREYFYAVRGISGVAGTTVPITTAVAGVSVPFDNIIQSYGTWSLSGTGGVIIGNTGTYQVNYGMCFVTSINTVTVSTIIKRNNLMIPGSQSTSILPSGHQQNMGNSFVVTLNSGDSLNLFGRASNVNRATVPTQSGALSQFPGTSPMAYITLYRIK